MALLYGFVGAMIGSIISVTFLCVFQSGSRFEKAFEEDMRNCDVKDSA